MRNARMDFIEKFYHPDFEGRQIGDLKLCYCGRRTGAPDHRFGPAARENYWFIYLKEGSGIYTVGGVTRRLKKAASSPRSLCAEYSTKLIPEASGRYTG